MQPQAPSCCCFLARFGALVFQQEPWASRSLPEDLRLDLCWGSAGAEGRALWPGARGAPS